MYGYVYKITNIINNKIYIGKRQSETFDEHYFGSGTIMKKVLEKYSKENFLRKILGWYNSETEIRLGEEYWIQYFLNQGYVLGKTMYNLKISSVGGDTYTYAPIEHQLEHKHKLSETMTGQKRTQETKGNISKAHKGKKHSTEWTKHSSEAKKLLTSIGIQMDCLEMKIIN